MALTVSERNALVKALLDEFGEDYPNMGRIIRAFRTVFPAVDWATLLTNIASSYQPFAASGLSVDWWVAEVLRYSA
jgi:hypothetical protein